MSKSDSPTTSVQKRIVSSLFVSQSFFSASAIAAFTLSPIISSALSGSDNWVGLPNTVVLLGRAGFALPLGYLMDRIGRRLALSGGYSMAVIGSAISVWAIVANSFPIFLLGALFLGMSRAAGDQSRYVGAEVFRLSRRAKVIGIIVSAGTIGAILGPLLVPASTTWMANLDLPEQAGPFIISGVLMIFATGAVFLFLRPDPKELGQAIAELEAADNPQSVENIAKEARPLSQIFSAPMVQLAVLSMVIGFFVMAFLMVITPLHMDHNNHSTTAISSVIMAHTLGMFGLSWLTGGLIDRFGRVPMIVAGTAVLAISCILAPISLQVPILGLALFLLGLGWNFTYVAGSSLLSDALASHERARAQGASEGMVAVGAGLSSLSVGLFFAQGGFLLVSMTAMIFTLLLALATYWLVQKDRRISTPVPEG
ncbi:MAG: MFS transporter [Anaerolineaceae bacterium]|nr:MAG: MFS transporter [Anaerolineaceae bacterium]